MELVVGVLDQVLMNGIGKGSGVVVNGLKYGSFDPTKNAIDQLVGKEGQEVRLQFVQKDNYKNLQGTVQLTGGVAAPASQGAAPAATAAPRNTGGYSRGAFPIGALDGQRSIIRQNAVTNANAFVASQGMTLQVDGLLELARSIEAYTTGDLDAQEVKDQLEALANPTH